MRFVKKYSSLKSMGYKKIVKSIGSIGSIGRVGKFFFAHLSLSKVSVKK
jgi:hypothetical protein